MSYLRGSCRLGSNQVTGPSVLDGEKQGHLEKGKTISRVSHDEREAEKGTVGFRSVSALCFLGVAFLANVVVNKGNGSVVATLQLCLSKSQSGGRLGGEGGKEKEEE